MTYFLDFDRTLFDTDAFTPTLVDNPACAPLKDEIQALVDTPRDLSIRGGAGRVELWEKLNRLCEEGALGFAPGELARFVFPDAAAFLKTHGKDSVILSYGFPAWIHAKVESALSGLAVREILYAEHREKGEALSAFIHKFEAPYVLVDDLAVQLDSVKEFLPDVSLFEMRRDGKEGSGRHAVIRSLAELPASV
jgi:hypothetical protein